MAFWKYIGAISPISLGIGTHSMTMCGWCLRAIADSKNTQSSSSDLEIVNNFGLVENLITTLKRTFYPFI